MKINKLIKNIILIISIFAFILIINRVESKAVLQSNGDTPVGYTPDQFLLKVREMETLGGGMGLTETIKDNGKDQYGDIHQGSTLTGLESNNIDVHMQKNTEYGAMAILSASSYGNPNVIYGNATTTGNVTGVVMCINTTEGEVTSSLHSELQYGIKTYFYFAANRYIDKGYDYYNEQYVTKIGDALLETKGWHVNNNVFFNYLGSSMCFQRGIGSIFGYSGCNYGAQNKKSRAVIVSGQGL